MRSTYTLERIYNVTSNVFVYLFFILSIHLYGLHLDLYFQYLVIYLFFPLRKLVLSHLYHINPLLFMNIYSIISLLIILESNYLNSKNINFFSLNQWNSINAFGDIANTGLCFNRNFHMIKPVYLEMSVIKLEYG